MAIFNKILLVVAALGLVCNIIIYAVDKSSLPSVILNSIVFILVIITQSLVLRDTQKRKRK